MTINAIHKRINELIEEKGWSLYKLAEKSGLPQSSLYTMMKRNTMPQLDTLEAICNGLGITLCDFFVSFSKVGKSEYVTEKDNSLLEILHTLPDSLYELVLVYAKGLSDAHAAERAGTSAVNRKKPVGKKAPKNL